MDDEHLPQAPPGQMEYKVSVSEWLLNFTSAAYLLQDRDDDSHIPLPIEVHANQYTGGRMRAISRNPETFKEALQEREFLVAQPVAHNAQPNPHNLLVGKQNLAKGGKGGKSSKGKDKGMFALDSLSWATGKIFQYEALLIAEDLRLPAVRCFATVATRLELGWCYLLISFVTTTAEIVAYAGSSLPAQILKGNLVALVVYPALGAMIHLAGMKDTASGQATLFARSAGLSDLQVASVVRWDIDSLHPEKGTTKACRGWSLAALCLIVNAATSLILLRQLPALSRGIVDAAEFDIGGESQGLAEAASSPGVRRFSSLASAEHGYLLFATGVSVLLLELSTLMQGAMVGLASLLVLVGS
ncbi:hypothetical protein AK812_SmicGene3422 [Symbiodinium microadriaticum]|uniref:Uncharacterized protein n=1 Tax=Symbiodinium microadriaticum TaxID=2951 RepID=A0A1Q9EZ33_SYMMI|nr:hypothetical protein AK812_SmicGene3422 [Symbiodinium microadriaticum]